MSDIPSKRKHEGKTFFFGKKKRGRDHSNNFHSKKFTNTTTSNGSEASTIAIEPSFQEKLTQNAQFNADEVFIELEDMSFYNHSVGLYQETDESTEVFTELDPSQEYELCDLESAAMNIDVEAARQCRNDIASVKNIEILELEDDDRDDNSEIDFGEFLNENEACDPVQHEGIDRVENEEFEKQNQQTTSIEGNRIVDLTKLFDDIRRLNSHSADDSCDFNDMVLIRETKFGFQSRFGFCCEKCGYLDHLVTTTENDETPNINSVAVLATLSVGLTYSTMVEFQSVFNIPSMTKSTFYKKEREWHSIINDVAEESMNKVAETERQECIKEGSVDEVGNALNKCFIDAAWSKRSYRSSYSASSGSATIIGAHTKKVIWNGVANKRCRICESARSAQTKPAEHKCNKNFVGPSTAMEPKLIKDGFIECASKYKIRFSHFVGDGDASVVVALNNAQIYKYPYLHIEKRECCNHLFKGCRCSLHKLAEKAAFRPYLSYDKVEKIIYYIRCARKHWVESSETYEIQIENVRKDIFNIPYHLYGDHTRCATYFCDGAKEGEKNVVPTLEQNNLMSQIQDSLARVRLNAKSVLAGESTNIVEQFNSLIVKFTGGKRVDLTSSGSFKARNQLAVIQHNTGKVLSTIFQAINKKPNPIMQHVENLKIAHNEYNSVHRKNHPKKKAFINATSGDEFYGTLTCQKLDMDPPSYDFEEKRYLNDLARRHSNRTKTEAETKLHEDSDKWNSAIHGMVTCSSFGSICSARNAKSYKNIVEAVLYPGRKGEKQTQHNLTYQPVAAEAFEKALGLTVVKSGFHTDDTLHFVGAAPYGTINEDAIIEISCPLSYFNKNVLETVQKDTLWIKDKNKANIIGMNSKHKEYYKVQGMMHVTNRQLCYYVVWPGNEGVIIWKVKRDDTFWERDMERKLKAFFEKALLPEIVDSRKSRLMPLQNLDSDGNVVVSSVESTI